MATLHSEEETSPSFFALAPGESRALFAGGTAEIWQEVELLLVSGSRRIAAASGRAFVLCRHPKDEIAGLLDQLQHLLEGSRDSVIFEPSEPSFEINIQRGPAGALKVEVWIDAGNAATGFYTFDAAGIRFFTGETQARRFLEEVRQEFPDRRLEKGQS